MQIDLRVIAYISLHQSSCIGAVEEVPVSEDWVTEHLCRHFIDFVNRYLVAWTLIADVEEDVG